MSKQVMQRALDALEDLKRQYSEHPDAFWDWVKARAAIAELRAAIDAQDNELHDATKGAMGKGGAGGPGHIELHPVPSVYYVGGGGGAGFNRRGVDIFHASTNIAFARGGSGSAQPDTEAMRKELERAKFSYMDGYEGGKQESRDAAHEEIGKLKHLLAEEQKAASIAFRWLDALALGTDTKDALEKLTAELERVKGERDALLIACKRALNYSNNVGKAEGVLFDDDGDIPAIKAVIAAQGGGE